MSRGVCISWNCSRENTWIVEEPPTVISWYCRIFLDAAKAVSFGKISDKITEIAEEMCLTDLTLTFNTQVCFFLNNFTWRFEYWPFYTILDSCFSVQYYYSISCTQLDEKPWHKVCLDKNLLSHQERIESRCETWQCITWKIRWWWSLQWRRPMFTSFSIGCNYLDICITDEISVSCSINITRYQLFKTLSSLVLSVKKPAFVSIFYVAWLLSLEFYITISIFASDSCSLNWLKRS